VLAEHFASGDMFLFPSHSETFGNVTLEAMASGVPTVAFDYGAAHEHLRDGLHGAAIADGDDAVIGSCTLFRFDANHRRAELGYALHPAQWGLGIAREAATLALDWAFDTLGLHRCDAGID
ncbi:GNAT family N-acetyltransferase, partial [Lysobacter sp. 2RAB21]